jgi:prepilin-type N-terminal cleavage/methylation domain-containing protein
VFNKLRSKKGFTLVELLIVIVILGILAAIVIARFAGATKESKESNLKGNLRTMRSSLETYKANSKSNSYPPTLDDLWKGTAADVDSKTFLERIPIDPFYRANAVTVVPAIFSPIDAATERDSKIGGGGGWAYDSQTGRVCANYKSTETVPGDPLDTSWGTKYNLW